MTQAEYEVRLRALEQQLQADIALLQAAHEVRVRSLEKLRQASHDGKDSQPLAPVQGTATAVPTRIPNRPRGAAMEDLARILPELPDTFDREDNRSAPRLSTESDDPFPRSQCV